MKYIKYILFSILLLPLTVEADNIYNVDMKINIDKSGNANVTETWDVKADSGTEWYKAYYNLDNIEISNYKVTMDRSALKYKDWDVDESLSQKKGYYGINYTNDGVELCFGKYDMKRHSFTMTYTISNFVFNTDGDQVAYFTLLPNATVDHFKINVSSYYAFPDTLDVWGYGYKGYAYVKDGKITMTNEDGLDEEYVVLLAKFPQNTFNTTNSYSQFPTFDSVLEKAKEGSYEHDYDGYGYESNDSGFIAFLVQMIFYAAFFLIPTIIAFVKVAGSGYGYKDNKKIDKKSVPMFRDIPCNKDIYYANALMFLNSFGYRESNVLGAIILKWVKENKIKFIKPKEGLFDSKTGSIDLTSNVSFENSTEAELFSLMRAASGDGILEAKELEKWCRKHYSKFLNLLDKIKNNEISRLKSENHIYKRTYKEECKKKNVLDDIIYKDSTELYGLKKFLDEFSRIDTKEVLEVHIWDEYLMFAYIFGIADKVAKQIKNLYPNLLEQNNIDFDTIIIINNISTSTVHAASAARSAAESYHSGGGGFGMGGGGGGSFGGGGFSGGGSR